MKRISLFIILIIAFSLVAQETNGETIPGERGFPLKPILDLDGDMHSPSNGFRGANWRGKDINDLDSQTRPGLFDNPIGLLDNNCNGIFGWPSHGNENYEDLLCKNSDARGVVAFGDSATAAFSIPVEWLQKVGLSEKYGDFFDVLRHEFDWPHKSWSTGFADEVQGESIYMRLRQRNLCNHRDYQNLGVNGNRARHFVDQVDVMARAPQDKPVLGFVAYIGNDICKKSLEKMTSEEEYRNQILAGLEALDKKLPAGSKVLCVGLVDGRILWNTLNDRQHPLGIKYSELYQFLTDLDKNPCGTWLNKDESIRDQASAHAAKLSGILKNIVETRKYQNFDLAYMDFPIDKILEEWVAAGKDPADLIEPVDGFHPSIQAHRLQSEYTWNYLLENHPDFLGPVNPRNNEIQALFGNQRGH